VSPVPPKPPRAPTDVPRERSGPTRHDRFALTPSPRPGSIATLRDDDEGDAWDKHTPVNASKQELMAFHVQRTDSTTAELKQSIAATNVRIDGVMTELGDLRAETSKLTGGVEQIVRSNDRLAGIMEKQLEASNESKKLTLTAQLNVGEQTALVPVQDAKARRENIAKIVALLTSAAFIITLIKLLMGRG
jgi:hypothetical protein